MFPRPINRHRPALGECVAAFANSFPVAFLENHFNSVNPDSILFKIAIDDIAATSLEAKGHNLNRLVGTSL